jgi:hypothetical protein
MTINWQLGGNWQLGAGERRGVAASSPVDPTGGHQQ